MNSQTEMNKASLKKLSKSVPTQRTKKPRPPIPTPRKSVKQMAKEYK